MKKDTENELENQDNWDFDQAETKGPVKSNRVVVSVAFQRTDFQLVSKLAQRLGKKTSEFIREAAVEKASGKTWSAIVYASTNVGFHWAANYLPNTTRLAPVDVKNKPQDLLVTS